MAISVRALVGCVVLAGREQTPQRREQRGRSRARPRERFARSLVARYVQRGGPTRGRRVHRDHSCNPTLSWTWNRNPVPNPPERVTTVHPPRSDAVRFYYGRWLERCVRRT